MTDSFGGDGDRCTGFCQSKGAYVHRDPTTIGEKVFAGCENLKNVVIPESVVDIGHNVFIGCEALQTIYYMGDADAWNAVVKAPRQLDFKERDGVPTKWE